MKVELVYCEKTVYSAVNRALHKHVYKTVEEPKGYTNGVFVSLHRAAKNK